MKTTIFLIRRHSKEECLVKVRESKMDKMVQNFMEDRHMFDKTLENRHMFEEIMEDKHMCEEKLKHWDREREAIYISPEICV